MDHSVTDCQPTNAAARDLATNAPVRGLTIELCTWLYATHQQLARELHRAQSTPAEEEVMIAVDTLPEATRRYLWRSMQRHHPDLAQFVRDPVIAAIRERFSASLHLSMADIMQLIVSSARASRRGTDVGNSASKGVAKDAGPPSHGVTRGRSRPAHGAAP